MSRAILLGVIACLSMAVGERAASQTASRSTWTYNENGGGYFQKASGLGWVEVTASARYSFRQVAQTNDFVQLYDPSRGISIKLHEKECYIGHAGANGWQLLYRGFWGSGPPAEFSFEYKGERKIWTWGWRSKGNQWFVEEDFSKYHKQTIKIGSAMATALRGPPVTGRKVKQTTRYLVIFNETPRTLNVSVQFYGYSSDGKLSWFPQNPEGSSEALVCIYAPGQVGFFRGGDNNTVIANRARIWATSDQGATWDVYKHRDLWLVEETDQQGYTYYYAPRIESLPLTISSSTSGALVGYVTYNAAGMRTVPEVDFP